MSTATAAPPPPPPPAQLPLPLDALRVALGPTMVDRIQASKLLVVGAGGIGCELLKDLALSGFRNLYVVDLDTIDVSNLNRQLLFRSPHVGQPKCTTACDVATKLASTLTADDDSSSSAPTVDAAATNGAVRYTAWHGNVCDASHFHVELVRGYDVVLSALDNLQARRTLNRLCLAAKVPLIEAGTTGYLGQVRAIDGSVACYECKSVETPKVFPICTIRSTPSRPVHTIVWAKEAFKLLLGKKVEESMLFESDAVAAVQKDADGPTDKDKMEVDDDPKKSDDIDTATAPPDVSTFMPAVRDYRKLCEARWKSYQAKQTPTAHGPQQDREAQAVVQALVQTLFGDEIDKQMNMGRYKAAAKQPKGIPKDVMEQGVEKAVATLAARAMATNEDDADQNHSDAAATATSTSGWTAAVDCVAAWVLELWPSPADNALIRAGPDGAVFDKDDAAAMRFVTAASNLRNHVFQIPVQSFHDAKGIAGNIIPAIATTNAVAAGLQIIQVYHLLRQKLEHEQAWKASAETSKLDDSKKNDEDNKENAPRVKDSDCRYINILRNPTRNGLLLTAVALDDPNPHCFVCRQARIRVELNLPEWTLQRFLERIVQKELGFQEPTLMKQATMFWEQGDGAEEEYQHNLPKSLPNLPAGGLQHGSDLTIQDFSQDLTVTLHLVQRADWPSASENADVAEKGGGTATEDVPFLIKGGSAAAAPQANGKTSPPESDSKVAAKPGPKVDDDDDDDDIVVVVASAADKKKRQMDKEDQTSEAPPAKRAKVAEVIDLIE